MAGYARQESRLQTGAHHPRLRLLRRKAKSDEAIRQYQEAIRLKPDNAGTHYNLGLRPRQQGQTGEAIRQFQEAIRLKPALFQAHLALAQNLPRLGRLKDAAFHLEEFLRTCPQENLEVPNSPIREQAVGVMNNLAWSLATRQPPQDRDGARAVRFGERACELTQYRQTIMVGTLAAAYAEAGRFAEAVTAAKTASTLAAQTADQALLARNQQLLELYREGRPYHEPAAPVHHRRSPPNYELARPATEWWLGAELAGFTSVFLFERYQIPSQLQVLSHYFLTARVNYF